MDTNICVSLATAKKLKTIGFPQDTLFYWVQIAPNEWKLQYRVEVADDASIVKFSAPMASEVVACYPKNIWITLKDDNLKRKEGVFYFVYNDNYYIVTLMVKSDDSEKLYELHHSKDQNESEARSAMLLFLRENDMTD